MPFLPHIESGFLTSDGKREHVLAREDTEGQFWVSAPVDVAFDPEKGLPPTIPWRRADRSDFEPDE